MFRRAVGSLLARRFSPRATPRAAPARPLHSLRDLPIGDGLVAAGAAAAALTAAGALAVQYFKKGTCLDESDDRAKEEDMKTRFGDWMKKYSKSYKDEEEKAMRFQRFKAAVNTFSSPPETLSCFADWTDQELRKLHAFPDGLAHDEEYQIIFNSVLAKGEPLMWFGDVKQGDTHATRVK